MVKHALPRRANMGVEKLESISSNFKALVWKKKKIFCFKVRGMFLYCTRVYQFEWNLTITHAFDPEVEYPRWSMTLVSPTPFRTSQVLKTCSRLRVFFFFHSCLPSDASQVLFIVLKNESDLRGRGKEKYSRITLGVISLYPGWRF